MCWLYYHLHLQDTLNKSYIWCHTLRIHPFANLTANKILSDEPKMSNSDSSFCHQQSLHSVAASFSSSSDIKVMDFHLQFDLSNLHLKVLSSQLKLRLVYYDLMAIKVWKGFRIISTGKILQIIPFEYVLLHFTARCVKGLITPGKSIKWFWAQLSSICRNNRFSILKTWPWLHKVWAFGLLQISFDFIKSD